MANYRTLITKWDEKSLENQDRKFFTSEKHVPENKLQVTDDIVCHKIVFLSKFGDK